jgi:hypothetical protein
MRQSRNAAPSAGRAMSGLSGEYVLAGAGTVVIVSVRGVRTVVSVVVRAIVGLVVGTGLRGARV